MMDLLPTSFVYFNEAHILSFHGGGVYRFAAPRRGTPNYQRSIFCEGVPLSQSLIFQFCIFTLFHCLASWSGVLCAVLPTVAHLSLTPVMIDSPGGQVRYHRRGFQLSPVDGRNRDHVAIGSKFSYSRQPISPVLARGVEVFQHVQVVAEYRNSRR